MTSRIDNMPDQDKLWELYLHTLAGYHGNFGANTASHARIAETALKAARAALAVWKTR